MHHDYGHILGRLRRCRALGGKGGWSACCPAHEDRNPSLHLWIGRRGELVARCMSNKGCTWRGIAEALGTRPAEWWPSRQEDDLAKRKRRLPIAEIERTYDYLDEDGTLLFQCVRYRRPAQPRFRQRRPLPGGRWSWSLEGVPMVLYNLPEILSRTQQPVIVVEGEKDAETLRLLGLVGTTSPCGSSAWRPEYARWLKGRRVVVLPDNDEPGRRYAASVAGSCLAHGVSSIRVVQLPGLEPGGDVTDWVDELHGHMALEDQRAALVEAIRAQSEYRSSAYWGDST